MVTSHPAYLLGVSNNLCSIFAEEHLCPVYLRKQVYFLFFFCFFFVRTSDILLPYHPHNLCGMSRGIFKSIPNIPISIYSFFPFNFLLSLSLSLFHSFILVLILFIFPISLISIYINLVSWGYNTHQWYLCRGVRHITHNVCFGYYTKQSDKNHSVRMWSISWLP